MISDDASIVGEDVLNSLPITASKVLVLGAGNYGTCLAQHLADLGHEVDLWSRSPQICQAINSTRKNPKYLPNFTLSPSIRAISNISPQSYREYQAIVIATPTQSFREVLGPMRSLLSSEQLLISAAKGIEIGSLKLPLEIVSEVLGKVIGEAAVVLSGPSFAIEVIQHQTDSGVGGIKKRKRCNRRSKIVPCRTFSRLYIA
jgi:glycerol-3-phosphate dehydrogenase (NAD(P)+)